IAAQTPRARSKTRTRATAPAIIRGRRRGLATGPWAVLPSAAAATTCTGAAGMGITMVPCDRGGASGLVAGRAAGRRTTVLFGDAAVTGELRAGRRAATNSVEGA